MRLRAAALASEALWRNEAHRAAREFLAGIEAPRDGIEDGKTAPSALAAKGEEAWSSMREKVGSARDSAKAAFEKGVGGDEPKE